MCDFDSGDTSSSFEASVGASIDTPNVDVGISDAEINEFIDQSINEASVDSMQDAIEDALIDEGHIVDDVTVQEGVRMLDGDVVEKSEGINGFYPSIDATANESGILSNQSDESDGKSQKTEVKDESLFGSFSSWLEQLWDELVNGHEEADEKNSE